MGDLTGIDRLTAVLTVADGRARSLLLTVGPEDAPVLTAVMDFTAKVTAPQVPEAVTAAIAGGTEPENTVLPADTLRLLRSWAALRSREVLAADLTLTGGLRPSGAPRHPAIRPPHRGRSGFHRRPQGRAEPVLLRR